MKKVFQLHHNFYLKTSDTHLKMDMDKNIIRLRGGRYYYYLLQGGIIIKIIKKKN